MKKDVYILDAKGIKQALANLSFEDLNVEEKVIDKVIREYQINEEVKVKKLGVMNDKQRRNG